MRSKACVLTGSFTGIGRGIAKRIPLERFAVISEIAGLVRYLASEQSGYMTGEVIDVNGRIDL